MGERVNASGLVIAGIGFFLTRFTVTLAIFEDPLRFYLAGVLPLVLGLGLAAFGVALAVADVEPATVRLVALWCVAGTVGVLVLVLLTLAGSSADAAISLEALRSRTYLTNFLIGGSVWGTLTGVYAARTRRQREALRQQANRLVVLNRLLRHEVLNALTAIRGYAGVEGDGRERARDVIQSRTDAIERAIEQVKYLSRSASSSEDATYPVDLGAAIEAGAAAVSARHPDAEVAVGAVPGDVAVRANDRLEHVVANLLENAVSHAADGGTVDVTVTATDDRATLRVRDRGPGLPDDQRALLEAGEIGDYDDPGTGFGLNVVRLLVESYRGTIETTVDEGTTVAVTLPRASGTDDFLRPLPTGLADVRPAAPHLLIALASALLAGVAYGLVAEALGGSIGIIGVLYGVRSPVVGWITHEFHSVVFGFVFLGLVSLLPARYRSHLPAALVVGVGWALALWLFAAGVVSPVWLRLLGIPAPLPSLSAVTLVAHLAWALTLAPLTLGGIRYVVPWLERRRAGIRRE